MTDGNDAAFPGKDGNGNDVYGMSKREYFAALALQGLLAGGSTNSTVTGQAVDLADALVKALEPFPTQPQPNVKTIGIKGASTVQNYIFGFGFDNRDVDLIVMLAVPERKVPTLADLTSEEAERVMAKAEEKAAARAAKKADAPPIDPDPPEEIADFAPNGPGSRLLSNMEASGLHKALAKFGIKDSKEHYIFASEVMGRKVNSLQAMTVASAEKVYEAALEKFGTGSQQAEYAARKAA